MRIAITGATGFIGRNLIASLQSSEHEVMAIVQPDSCVPESWNFGNVKIASCSLLNDQHLLFCLKQFGPEVVIHLAWTGIPHFSLENCLTNIQISTNLINAVSSLESVHRLVVAGSCLEYARENGVCVESDETSSQNEFTWAKNSVREFAELVCKNSKISLCWLRIFYVYGPGQRGGALLPTVIKSAQNYGAVPKLSNPECAHDFIYIDDLIVLLKAIIEVNSFISGTYNAGSGRLTSVGELCNIALSQYSQKNPDFLFERLREPEVLVGSFASVELSRQTFDWRATTSVNEGVSTFIRYFAALARD